MKQLITIFIFVFGLIIVVQAKDIFVATTGNDATGAGTLADPYQTIQKAANVAISGDVVQVIGGVYREEVTHVSNGVTYRPYNGESVTINGADLMTAWTLSTGTTYQTTMGWDVDPTWGSNQVFSDGTMIELARWPDQTSTDIVVPTNAIADAASASGNIVTFTDADFNEPDGRWVGAQIWINLSRNGVDGMGRTFTVTATNAAAHTISFDYGTYYTPKFDSGPYGIGANTEYFLFNPTATGVTATGAVDALLSNGEWWKDGNILYVKTPNGSAPSATGTGTNVIEAKHRHFAFTVSTPKSGYTIKGFNLFGCSITTDNNPWNSQNSAWEEAHDILIDGITAKYVSHQASMEGHYQLQFHSYTGIVLRGRNNTIQNSSIQYSATSALSVTGAGNKVLNNEIYNTNYMCANSGAVNNGSVDAEIANNTIYNTSIMAIYFPYAKNSNVNVPDVLRIHHNTIYNFMRRSGDSGAIDAPGADLQWARIDHNTIYNTTTPTGNNTFGIYLDFGNGNNDYYSRCTIDHNVIYNIPVPVLISSTRFVNVYNNVLIGHPGYSTQPTLVNWGGSLNGIDNIIYNNIMSGVPNTTGGSPNLSLAVMDRNITNATGTVLTDLFVDAANHDYHLKPTATAAIDKGRSVGIYDDGIIALVDIGAFEQGTIADAIPPSVPSGVKAHTITNNSFTLSWTASTDNVQVTGYDIYVNDTLTNSTPNTTFIVSGLAASTTYSITVKAKDYYNNTSIASAAINVSTIALPGRTIHLEAKNNNGKLGGSTSSGVWTGYKTNSQIQFNGVSLSKQTVFTAYASSTSAGVQFEVHLNSNTGPVIGTLTLTATGGADKFEQQSTVLTGVPTGIYTLFIVVKNIVINTSKLDWVELSGGDIVGSIPTIPQELTTTFVGGTRLKLKWNGSIDDVAVTGYEVFKDGVSEGTTTVTSMLFEDLSASTSYSFTVRARDEENNWSEKSSVLNVTTNNPKLEGTIIGIDGDTWAPPSDIKETVFDENIYTFFDSKISDFAWAGLELSSPNYITDILFFPRLNGSPRMIGGVFQASNSADFSTDVVTLYAVTTRPEEVWNGMSLKNTTAYKYVRYKAPAGGYGNIAEVEFYGSDSPTDVSEVNVKNELLVFPNPACDQITLKNLEKNSIITINSIDGKTIYKNVNLIDGDFKLAVSDWNRGIYIVSVQTKTERYTQKLVLK